MRKYIVFFVVFLSMPTNAQSPLPPCPTAISPWTNCVGTYTWRNGGTYVGEFKDDKRDGQGMHEFPDGTKYVGAFKDGAFNGQGTFTWPDGDKYVGEFKDSKRNGQGIFYNSNGSVKMSGMWRDGQLSQSLSIDAARFPFGAGGSPDVQGSTTRESNKKTSVEMVNDCLENGLKPGTPQFSACVASQ